MKFSLHFFFLHFPLTNVIEDRLVFILRYFFKFLLVDTNLFSFLHIFLGQFGNYELFEEAKVSKLRFKGQIM